MKKIFCTIIFTFCIFSTLNFANAQEWALDKVLDLPYWVEEFEIKLPQVKNHFFINKSNSNSLKNFKNIDSNLRNIFIEKYRNWEFDYKTTNWIIQNYSLFVYHTNKYFEYLSTKERNPKFKEVNTAISRNYNLSRSYLKKVKYIIEENKK